jgi:multidrug efflux pump subunit AcrA (membrane-fusion protein)
LSAIHRAVLWISPLSWFLHNRIVRAGEEASDDAAVAATRDRTFYAEVLLGFMQRGVRGANWPGVPMARYGRADRRIHRVLDGTPLSPAITRWAVAAIVAVVPLLAYLVATAHPSQAAPQAPARSAPPASAPTAPVKTPEPVKKPQDGPTVDLFASPTPGYLIGLGAVTATTVNVTARVDGQLASVGFVEGRPVENGQLLASIESPQLRAQLDRRTDQLSQDRKAQSNEPLIRADEAAVAGAQRDLAYGQVRAPISGLAGLRKVDPGNFVRVGDTLLVITQLQPIAVVFSIPEDALPQAQALVRSGATPIVEAWTRDASKRLAIGRLTAIDNEIDKEQGTIKLKASFDNKDGALFPNQFVNVRVPISAR